MALRSSVLSHFLSVSQVYKKPAGLLLRVRRQVQEAGTGSTVAWLSASWFGTSSRQPTKARCHSVDVCVRGTVSPLPTMFLLVFVRKRLDTSGFCVHTPPTDSGPPVRTGTNLSSRNSPNALIRWQNDITVLNAEHPGR